MNTLEDRVRAATLAAADTVPPDSVPPLWLPPARPAGGSRRHSWLGSPWPRRLAPLAAALAVVALAVATVLVGRAGQEPAPAPGTGTARPGLVTAGPPVSSYVASGVVPPYFVSIESHGNPNFNPSYAVVRATVTGAAIATIPASVAHGAVTAVTAAADDRTFVLDEQPFVATNTLGNQFFEPRTFYLVRLGASGRPSAPARLPMTVPGGEMMTGFALSPDGSRLAIAVQPDNVKNEPSLQQIRVYALATGGEQTWSAAGTIGFGPDDARSLSWADDERTLAFYWIADGPGVHTSVRLLDIGTGGGNLLADSRQAVSLVNQPLPVLMPTTVASPAASPYTSAPSSASGGAVPPLSCDEDSIITPDGSAIVCGAITVVNQSVKRDSHGDIPGLQRGAETEFLEYSTATGKVTRILGRWTFGSVGALSVEVLWSNASGSVLIGVIPNAGGGQVGVISGNKFTPLPMATASVPSVSGTW